MICHDSRIISKGELIQGIIKINITIICHHDYPKKSIKLPIAVMTIWSLNILIQSKNFAGAAEKLRNKPSRANKFDKAGSLPIHHACKCGAPPELIKALIEACPASLYTENFVGQTPLDVARMKYPVKSPHHSSVIAMLEGSECKIRATPQNDDLHIARNKPFPVLSELPSRSTLREVRVPPQNEAEMDQRTGFIGLVANAAANAVGEQLGAELFNFVKNAIFSDDE